MFTPPPSPLPPVRKASPDEWDTHISDEVQTGQCPIDDTRTLLSKRKFCRSIRYTMVFVPLALILLAAYTRFRAHPAFFDLLSTDCDHEQTSWSKLTDWSLHEPHKAANNRLVDKPTSSPLVARDKPTPVPAPTVPSDPVLPTRFPQPFDTTLSANFSTTSCYDFFLNMTQVDAFRSCRPFSLLLATSHAFLMAQKDINLVNTDIWGICNTDVSQVQCDANMSWFASTLQSSCEIDLGNEVATAVTTLNALRAYDLMRNVACQVNPATNSYCFVEAIANPDPSHYWFYQLPLGQPLGPGVTANACSKCTSTLMGMYASALNVTDATSLEGLAKTYNAAVGTLNQACGPSYAAMAQLSTSSSAWMNAGAPSWLVALGVLMSFAHALGGWM